MKVEIEKEEKGFKPFKLTLTVESEDELKWLYHIFNASYDQIERTVDKECNVDVPRSYPDRSETWKAIRNKCIELGIYKV